MNDQERVDERKIKKPNQWNRNCSNDRARQGKNIFQVLFHAEQMITGIDQNHHDKNRVHYKQCSCSRSEYYRTILMIESM
jgi:hypothetical protein